MEDFYTKKEIDKNTIEFTITLPKENFEKSYEMVLKDFTKDTNVKGFRKGKLPADLLDNGTKQALKLDTFEKLAPLYVSTAISKENLEPIAPPEYMELPKFIDGLDITFNVKVTTMPEFKLGNVKKIKIKQEDVKVEDKEIEDALKELKDTQESKETEINDKWAKDMGKIIGEEKIKTLEELKTKIKDALKTQKEHVQMHSMQDEALREGIKISKIEIPQPAIDYEAQQREQSFTQDMQGRGVKIEDFLKANNITMEKMRELWIQDSTEALQSDTFLGLYAKDRDLKVSQEDLDKKIDLIKQSQPNADPSIFSNPEWIEYVRRVEIKERAFREFIKEVLGEDFLDQHN